MRRLYLLRHAKSSWDDPALDDYDRPLNGRGRAAARLMAAHLRAARLRPDLVLCSGARRTRQTLDSLEAVLDGVPAVIEPELYEADRTGLLARLRRLDDRFASVLVIGHNPGLERLAEALAGGQGDGQALARLAAKFPTGALAVLDGEIDRWAELDHGTCRLAAFVRPKDLDKGT